MMCIMNEEFADLLARARLGEADALARLIQQYEPEVRIVARVRLGAALRPHLDSIDLVQSVHKSLLLGLRNDRFDITTPEKLVALALAIVRRKVARKWRKLSRQKPMPAAAPGDSSLHQMLSALQSPEPDPQKAAQLQEVIRQVCDSLEAKDRRLLELRWEGNSTAEAARQMNEDPDVLRVRLSRLRRFLREKGLLDDWL